MPLGIAKPEERRNGEQVEAFAGGLGGPNRRKGADAATPHAGIGWHVKHRGPGPAQAAGHQATVEKEGQIEGAAADGADNVAGDTGDADARMVNHGE